MSDKSLGKSKFADKFNYLAGDFLSKADPLLKQAGTILHSNQIISPQ